MNSTSIFRTEKRSNLTKLSGERIKITVLHEIGAVRVDDPDHQLHGLMFPILIMNYRDYLAWSLRATGIWGWAVFNEHWYQEIRKMGWADFKRTGDGWFETRFTIPIENRERVKQKFIDRANNMADASVLKEAREELSEETFWASHKTIITPEEFNLLDCPRESYYGMFIDDKGKRSTSSPFTVLRIVYLYDLSWPVNIIKKLLQSDYVFTTIDATNLLANNHAHYNVEVMDLFEDMHIHTASYFWEEYNILTQEHKTILLA